MTMRQRTRTAALLAVSSAFALPACGGSSSETPPPLEPDARGFHYAPAAAPVVTEASDAGDAPPLSSGVDDDDKAHAKASSPSSGSKPDNSY